MAQPENSVLSSAFMSHFEQEKLTGPNFNDWYRSLRIVLRVADKLEYLNKPCPNESVATEPEDVKAAWRLEYKKHNEVACIMLGSMSTKLQKQFEHYFPYNMLQELQQTYEKPSDVELYDLIDALHSCKHGEGKPVSDHVLEMKS